MLYLYADTRAPGRCRSCGADLVWAVLISGARHPFNAPLQAVETQVALFDVDREIHGVEKAASHFATCPDATTWRKKRYGGDTFRVSHFVPFDSPGHRKRQALCGLTVHVRDHADAPTCRDCRVALEHRERSVGP